MRVFFSCGEISNIIAPAIHSIKLLIEEQQVLIAWHRVGGGDEVRLRFALRYLSVPGSILLVRRWFGAVLITHSERRTIGNCFFGLVAILREASLGRLDRNHTPLLRHLLYELSMIVEIALNLIEFVEAH
jgi:hypothetical protein